MLTPRDQKLSFSHNENFAQCINSRYVDSDICNYKIFYFHGGTNIISSLLLSSLVWCVLFQRYFLASQMTFSGGKNLITLVGA